MIYYDDFKSWGHSFGNQIVDLVGKEALLRLASSNFEYIEEAGDLIVFHTDILSIATQIEGWFRKSDFCVIHGTRLLPEEVISIQQFGLRPLVASEREQRLVKILERHPKWNSLKGRLGEVLEDVGPPS